jgi:hypothetical protein
MEGRVQFIPVKHGGGLDTGNLGIFGVSGNHKYLGFKPAPGRKREGWLVVLVTDTGKKPRRKL